MILERLGVKVVIVRQSVAAATVLRDYRLVLPVLQEMYIIKKTILIFML